MASTLSGPGGVSGVTPNGTGAKLDSTPPSGAPAAAAPPMMGVGGGDLVGTSGVSMPVIGPELRPGIGTRQYPQSNLVLAGLKRAY